MTSAWPKPHYIGHRKRLKKKFLTHPSQLEDYEILELLLGYVLLRSDTKPLAKELLRRFQNFKGVLDVPPAELSQVPGTGPALQFFWLLIRECKARYVESPIRQRHMLATPEHVAMMARQRLAGLQHEELWGALVDSQNRLIEWVCLVKGNIDYTHVEPRDVLIPAYELKASGIILAHNHPGASSKPSASDIEMTGRVAAAAEIMGVRFLDHLIVTEASFTSMAQESLMPRPKQA